MNNLFVNRTHHDCWTTLRTDLGEGTSWGAGRLWLLYKDDGFPLTKYHWGIGSQGEQELNLLVRKRVQMLHWLNADAVLTGCINKEAGGRRGGLLVREMTVLHWWIQWSNARWSTGLHNKVSYFVFGSEQDLTRLSLSHSSSPLISSGWLCFGHSKCSEWTKQSALKAWSGELQHLFTDTTNHVPNILHVSVNFEFVFLLLLLLSRVAGHFTHL